MNYVQRSWVCSNFLQNVSPSLLKGAPGKYLQRIDFLLNDVSFDILALARLVLGIQRKEDLDFDLPILLADLSWF